MPGKDKSTLNRRQLMTGAIATSVAGEVSTAFANACSIEGYLDGKCGGGEAMPSRIMALWLIRTMGHCFGQYGLDDPSYHSDALNCLGLQECEYDFVQTHIKADVDTINAFQKVADTWSAILSDPALAKAFPHESQFSSTYTGHACPKAAQIVQVAQLPYDRGPHAKAKERAKKKTA